MDEFVKLAKDTVERFISGEARMAIPENLPAEFYSRRAGVFVTIRQNKDLRGCIGTFLPTKKNIAEEIVSNAIAACSRDNRFEPVSRDELMELSYEVSILSEPRQLKNLEKHDPKRHGLIVKCADGRCGLLLPDLEGVETTEHQIMICCQKGGIDPDFDQFEKWEFEVEKHS